MAAQTQIFFFFLFLPRSQNTLQSFSSTPSKGSFENDTQKFVTSFSGNVFKCFLQFNGYLIELQKDHLRILVVLKSLSHLFWDFFQLVWQFNGYLSKLLKDHLRMLVVLKVCHIFSGNVFNWFWQFNGYSPKLERGSFEDTSISQSLSHLFLEMVFNWLFCSSNIPCLNFKRIIQDCQYSEFVTSFVEMFSIVSHSLMVT